MNNSATEHDTQAAQTPTMADWEAYWAHEEAKLKRNDLEPTTMREWQQRGPDRRQADRRTAEANYTFHNALTETRLTWKEELFIWGVFLVAVGLFVLAMMEVGHLRNGS